MKKKLMLFITLVLLMNSAGWSQSLFVHQTTAGNTNVHISSLPGTGFTTSSSALLFITQQFGKYNAHQVGVWHNGQQWTIYNEDRIAMVTDTYFSVVQVPASANAYTHVATASNINSNYTFLDNAYCNNNPNAIIMLTQNYKQVYNTSPVGMWYTNGKWAIFNQDLKAMPVNAAFNVWIVNAGGINGFSMNATAFKHTATLASKSNNNSNHISNLGITSSKNIILATQNWGSSGPYNSHHPGVWWNGTQWTVFNQDRIAIPDGSGFNIISFSPKVAVVPVNTEIDPSESYRLTTQWQGEGKSLDILNDGTNNHPWLGNSGPYSGQYWKLTPVGSGYYRLTTQWLGEGKSLDIINDGTNNNQPVMTNSGPYSGQFWKLTALPGGFFRLTTQWLGDGKSLDVINDGRNDQVILAATDNVSGQYWKLTKL
jgi:hypothetical protein